MVFNAAAEIRLPAVAGTFYPALATTLHEVVDRELAAATARAHAARHEGGASDELETPCPKALIAPHAGYVYSAPIAASAYALLQPFADRIERVVLLGPAHRVYLEGIAAPDARALRTPLGDLVVDWEFLERAIAGGAPIGISSAAHAREHSLEVHLPFLQRVAPHAKLVPLVVGRAPAHEVARALEALWGGPETVIIASSDLSHYLPYDVGRERDTQTATRIVELDRAPLEGEDACGCAGINGLLTVARERHLAARLLDLRSSGDTAGNPGDEVVGYGAFAFFEPSNQPKVTGELGRSLVRFARACVIERLGGPEAPIPRNKELAQMQSGTFVTLRWTDGRLQGCIGNLEPRDRILEDIEHNAIAAATRDPRGKRLSLHDVDSLDVELSVLSPHTRIVARTEEEALAQIVPHRHGVTFEHDSTRATLLPAVWEHIHDARSFMAALKEKAGYPVDFWDDDVQISLYTADKYVDRAPKAVS